MKFNSLPVHDLTDATRDFEQLQIQGIFNDTALGGALAGKLPNPSLATGTVLQLVSTGTTRKTAFGQTTVTWPGASTNTNAPTVTHGIGGTPVSIVITPVLASTGNFWWPVLLNIGATTFQVQGTTGTGGAQPVNGSTGFCYWLAIG